MQNEESFHLETNNNQREFEYAKVKVTYDIPCIMPYLERLKRLLVKSYISFTNGFITEFI